MTQAFNLSQLANNLNTTGQLDATDGLTGSVPVANGGTGRNTLTANNVILGNGTSAVNFVAPSTSGNVLTSNGSSWVSSTPPTPTIADGSVTDPKIADGITAGGTYISLGGVSVSRTGNTSYTLFAQSYTLRGGSFNFQILVRNNNIGNENPSTITARIYRDGVAISGEASVYLGTNQEGTITISNVTLSRGGNCQLYMRNSSGDANRVALNQWTFGISTDLKINPFTSPTSFSS